MRKQYKLDCFDWNQKHVKFNVFDTKGANCGALIILTDDVINFVKYSWNGDIFWNKKMPLDVVTASNI